jgi:AraC-like DNA-binding protein
VFVIAAAHQIQIASIKQVIPVYILFITLILAPMITLNGSIGVSWTYIWYILTPVGIYVIYPDKKCFYWIIYVFCLLLLSCILSYVLRHQPIPFPGYKNAVKTNHIRFLLSKLVAAINAFILMCYYLYFIHKLHEIKLRNVVESIQPGSGKNGMTQQHLHEEKYDDLYNQIVEHFKTDQPYIHPKFNVTQLANNLNTNVAYISKAIRLKKDMNFNQFINDYRIDKIKEMIQNNQNKYTLEYIFTSAGFRNQSTFNKAFKQKEGITPSQYCKHIKH